MRNWRSLIGSVVASAGSVAVLAAVRNVLVDIAAGAVLVVALTVLARSAIRTAADPARRDLEHR
jgi:hypothetical protein